MVCQRESPVTIWGTGQAGKNVEVYFQDARIKVTCGADGKWEATLPPMKACSTPAELKVESEGGRLVLKDILVGDVWICAGQSNMEWPLSRDLNAKDSLASAEISGLRLLNYSYPGQYRYANPFTEAEIARLVPEKFFQGQWQVSSSKSAAPFSAAGFYFGKKIHAEVDVPVGMVNYAIGGSPIETWISTEALARDARFRDKVNQDWLTNPAMDSWVRQRGREQLRGVPKEALGQRPSGPIHSYAPGIAFEWGPGRIARFPVKGFLWYQGESNSLEEPRVAEYRALFKILVDDWRACWKQPKAPFYWVQLSSISEKHYKSQFWPRFRNDQRLSMSDIENGGMAVCSDAGAERDVHPRNKKVVGERLAAWALNQVYGKAVVPSGPLPQKVSREGKALKIVFTYADGGLKTSDGQPPREFEVAGKDGKFFPAEATIRNGSVEVISSRVPSPRKVRYGWIPFSRGNLVNSAGLPASTFEVEISE
ncbi:MAG: sialate O-acetylesterase, partial [Puniceicoccales bacterium]|jgi:sialate O-acetylesterase|nr:sialate O-acetylesterase [Puniceicoccales bacterium]